MPSIHVCREQSLELAMHRSGLGSRLSVWILQPLAIYSYPSPELNHWPVTQHERSIKVEIPCFCSEFQPQKFLEHADCYHLICFSMAYRLSDSPPVLFMHV
ncbi:hypothetical protein BDQ94DRAFT_133048 [Aspergillus welwitschiae]|uniref:Uncharacterized protein n=1 Tax=Aspergillus welwitschiae TaxID=1341132 RepID=A0A3F3QJG8_9EURO|nr:hypothetical protein BDQ94DRAFT_133048 [Aspergillus welwitschiae]RDH39423.1 hypothetical protein BDQ94DRAFT_133048 [Aspergillus welwitschiae]